MEDYLKHHRTLHDEDLVRIAFFERGKMKKEARASARKILLERKITGEKLNEIKNEIRRRKRQESRSRLRDKNDTFGIFDFLFEMLTIWIH